MEGELSADLTSAFPSMKVEVVEQVQTLLSGPVEDTAELLGVINHLDTVGIELVELVRIPDD